MLNPLARIFILLLIFIFPQRISADWPMFRNDHSHSGSSQYEITKQPGVVWSTQNIGESQGNLTVDSEGNIYTGTSNFQLIAIDKDGNHKWNYKLTFPTNGLVFDNNGNLYFSISGSNPFIYSLTKSGAKIWEYNLRLPGSTRGQYGPSGPITISKDKKTLYTGIRFPSKTIIALNLNGTIKWQVSLSSQNPSGSVTIADSGNLYIGTDENGRLISLDENGIQRWSKTVGSGFTVSIQTPILDENENVYVTASGVRGGNLLVSYDSAGTKRWQYQIANSTFAGSPAYKNGSVYIVEKTSLSAINSSDGTLKWKWNAQLPSNRTLTSPSVDNLGNIIITGSNTLYVFSPEGQVQWSIPVADALGPPIISDNNLIYTHQSLGSTGSVYKLGDTTPTPAPKTPLILIPGIGGSELKVNEDTVWNKDDGHGGMFNRAYSKDEKVWVNEEQAIKPGDDDYFDVLRMKPDGITSEASIGLTGNLYTGAYQATIDFFTSNGYTLNQDLFVFPYDWRKDISLTRDLLDQKISQIKNQTGAQKVDIIAHSMGGLVARNYISDSTKAQNVRKLFTLGTPHLGAPDFLRNLRYGGCLRFEIGPFCLSIAPTEVKDVLQNMITGFQLAPAQSYFNFYSGEDNQHIYPYKTESGTLDYLQIKNLLTTLGHNTALFNPSETFHSIDNTLPTTNGVKVTVIAGSGKSTLGQIVEEKTTSLLGTESVHRDIKIINGDETVPLFSASLDDPSTGKSLLGSAKVYYTNQKHGNLVVNGPALNLVKNILQENNELPTGVSTEAYSLPIIWSLSVHSPVNIHAYDANGNHTGPTSNGFEAKIPGSSYDTLDDAKFIYLPDNENYTVKFEALDNGKFDFKIRKFENNINIQTILYKNVPLTKSTKVETVLNTPSDQVPILQIDVDGNSSIDSQINAFSNITGAANYDQTPPQTTISLEGIKEGHSYKSAVIVTLISKDQIEYTLDNGQTIQTYLQPFTVSAKGTTKLKFKATDKAGNEEIPQNIEIEISSPANDSSGSNNNSPGNSSAGSSNTLTANTSTPQVLGSSIRNSQPQPESGRLNEDHILGIQTSSQNEKIINPKSFVDKKANAGLNRLLVFSAIVVTLASGGLIVTFLKPIPK